jgi:hypothetical protein
MNKNLCVYCKSPAYGPGCPFSPSGKHFHVSDPKKCCFCGSVAVGPGCPFNPHTKMHVHGIEFNSMVKETIDKGITLGYLMNTINTPITEMKAYELGIIDRNGKRIRTPETAEELSAYSSTDQYIINIKNSLGKNLDLIQNSMELKLESIIDLSDYQTITESTLNIKQKFENLGKEFNEIVASAYNAGLSTPIIEKLIIESILEK